MDGKNSRGAYAQVTAPIGDDTHVTVKQGGKGQGTGAVCTRTRLILAVLLAVIIIIIIIAVAVVVSKNNKSGQSVQGTTQAPSMTKEMVPSSPSLSQSSMTDAMTTARPPMPTTFGPAVIGSFNGSLVFERAYVDSFDDMQLRTTIDFMTNISNAIAQVFDPDAPYMYHSTEVDRLLKNGINVAAEFTVSVDAINRGASDHLIETIRGEEGFPSTVLKTYTVSSAEVGPEVPGDPGA